MHPDAVQQIVKDPENNMFLTGESDELIIAPVFKRLSFFDDFCFSGLSVYDCLATMNKLLKRFTECRISATSSESIFVKSGVDSSLIK